MSPVASDQGLVVAVANQKGGVAKTTTTLSIAGALTARGLSALVVDCDPQACATFGLGFDPDALDPTLHEVVAGDAGLADTVVGHPETDLAPACIDLAGAETALLARTGREHVLTGALAPLRAAYDAVLLDCPPSLGVLTLNALTAADRALIPLQCETLSHRGVAQLLDTIADVQRLTNPALEVAGLAPVLYDGRTRHARAVLADVTERYALPLVGPPVRKSVRFAEAPNRGVTIHGHDPTVPGAAAYRVLAARLLGLPVDAEDEERAAGR